MHGVSASGAVEKLPDKPEGSEFLGGNHREVV